MNKDFDNIYLCGWTGKDLMLDETDPCHKCDRYDDCLRVWHEIYVPSGKRPLPDIPLRDFQRMKMVDLAKKYKCSTITLGRVMRQKWGKTKYQINREYWMRKKH